MNAWTVDLNRLTATHQSGFKITVEGDPINPCGVVPGKFPDGLSAVEQAGLLRCGVQALADAATEKRAAASKAKFAERTAAFANRPARPKLSLKKSSP